MEDLELGRSQYLRLSWHCSIETIYPIHLMPLVTCCSASNSKAFARRQDWLCRGQMYCLECGGAFHRARRFGCRPTSHLRCSLPGAARACRIVRQPSCKSQWQDTFDRKPIFLCRRHGVGAHALMLLVAGSPYRALHSLRTPAFPVPLGFNTPVNSNNWLCCGPLPIRRSIFGVLASLLLPPTLCDTLIPDGGTASHSGNPCGHCKAQRSAGRSGIELIDEASRSSKRSISSSKGFSTS
jgi:hypothetical protein